MTVKLNGSSSGSISIDAPANTTGGADIALTLPEKGFGFTSYAILADQKAAGTGGGASSANAWTESVLNTEIADPDSIVSISSNQFTLGAGNYLIKWVKTFFNSHRVTTRLYDVTNSAVKQYGMNSIALGSSGEQVECFGIARVTPTGSTAYKFEYYVDNADSDGLGCDTPDDEGVNIYSHVEIYKEA